MNNLNNIKNISVIIPAYKSDLYIEECLDSIYKQEPYEILVGVDGCRDTLNKLLNISNKYHNLRIFYSEQNVGCYVTRNSLVNYSLCNKILFFDSDDKMDKNLVNIVCEQLNDNDMIRYQLYEMTPNKTIACDYYAMGTFGINKDIFIKTGGFHNWKCSADSEYYKRTEKFFKVKYLKIPLMYYRRHSGSLTKHSETNASSKIRNEFKNKIKNKYSNYYVKPVLNENLIEVTNNKKLITFNMATYPPREKFLKKCVESILPICDKLRVYLNEYTSPPEFLLNNSKIEYIINDKNIGANGKFFWANSYKNEYYFTADDDFEYSKEYVEKHIQSVKKYGKCFITSHGRLIKNSEEQIYDKTRCISASDWSSNLINDIRVNIGGTGVMCFDNSLIKIDINEFEYIKMVDIYLAKLSEENNIPIIIRNHKKNELNYLMKNEEIDTIWKNKVNLFDKHKEITKNMSWELNKNNSKNAFESFDRIFVINLNYDIKRMENFIDTAVKYNFYENLERFPGIESKIGAFGCAQSLKNVLRISRERNYNNIIVFQDDAFFLYKKDYVNNILNKILLNDKYDILLLGINPMDKCKNKNTNFEIGTIYKPLDYYGCFSVIYKKNALKVFDKIPDDLNKFEKNDRDDVVLARSSFNIYSVYPALTSVLDYQSHTGVGLEEVERCKIKNNHIKILSKYEKLNLIDYENIIFPSFYNKEREKNNSSNILLKIQQIDQEIKKLQNEKEKLIKEITKEEKKEITKEEKIERVKIIHGKQINQDKTKKINIPPKPKPIDMTKIRVNLFNRMNLVKKKREKK